MPWTTCEPQKRTIFINDNKYYLKFPYTYFFKRNNLLYVFISKTKIYQIDLLSPMPLPNIKFNGEVCFHKPITEDTAIDQFWNTKFNTDIVSTIMQYVQKYDHQLMGKLSETIFSRIQFYLDNPIKAETKILLPSIKTIELSAYGSNPIFFFH